MKREDILFIPYLGFLALIAPEPWIPRALVIFGGLEIYFLIEKVLIKRTNTK
ncbi:hypothetical protein GOQ27_09105 [Clostridium sp. D2Q-11]|uniref:Uncharacterized protein n=1 Tax=Anaeromonas frigoriresistens TaxID=2683708 RepID=A0A942UYF1_9FIRM|nr:hypothetical protein [Anaeromonas frigoriresistens]MBS4538621.1 hypothetical protein [Anaeromonas frigoriresistens]